MQLLHALHGMLDSRTKYRCSSLVKNHAGFHAGADICCACVDTSRAQVKELKEGKSVDKPIYNHVTGNLDPAETIASPNVSAADQQPALAICSLHVINGQRCFGYQLQNDRLPSFYFATQSVKPPCMPLSEALTPAHG